ncbi:hypothetical protein AB0M44_25025, partial [Streptosporangium subroseum]|uniref:hypothetical protein n=1 Tax=Streptosporangium subroseum TaxID=106412 RepID=UPI003449ECA1
MIGGDADGLADHADPGREATGYLGVLVRLFRIAVAKGPLGRHKVTGDQVGKVERKGTQLVADLLVELLRGDVRGERRQLLTLSARGLITAAGPFVPAVTGARAISLTAESTVAAAERTPAAVIPVERRPLATAGTIVTVERGPITATIVTVERRPIPTTIVAIERGPLPATGTVITIERRPVTTGAAVLATGLITVTVTRPRRPLATTGTVIAVERGPLATAGTIVTVERRTVTTAVVAVERRTIPTAGPITIERRT